MPNRIMSGTLPVANKAGMISRKFDGFLNTILFQNTHATATIFISFDGETWFSIPPTAVFTLDAEDTSKVCHSKISTDEIWLYSSIAGATYEIMWTVKN